MKNRKVKIAKDVVVTRKKEKEMEKKLGGSNVGKYKNVPKKDFAGPAGGSPMGSFPINTLEKAKSALKLAHNAPNPAGIRAKVLKKYPSLRKKNEKNKKD